MVYPKCYNYKGKFCKNWEIYGTVPHDNPDLCKSKCKFPHCRGYFTYLEKDGSKTCVHCPQGRFSGAAINYPDIDKPIPPFPLLTDDVIQDLEICYDADVWKKQKDCTWRHLTSTNQFNALEKHCGDPDFYSGGPFISEKCYNYKGRFCKDWKVLGTVPDHSPDLCKTECKADPSCRGHFTYLDPKDRSKTCFHCTGEEKYPNIDKPIPPVPVQTNDEIQDLELCHSYHDLKEFEKCYWDNLSHVKQYTALEGNCRQHKKNKVYRW